VKMERMPLPIHVLVRCRAIKGIKDRSYLHCTSTSSTIACW